MGIPTMVITREGFSANVSNGFAGIGFSAESPTIYEFPLEMFIDGSDLTPLTENIDKIVYGLTKWEPEVGEKGLYPAGSVTVEGKDYEEALTNMNLLFLKNMWSDALPLLPPTEERVNWILTGTDLSPDALVTGAGKVGPRGGMDTVESLAVCLAMAGGRPEYLPLLTAIMEAITWDDELHWNSTTNSRFPVVVVNGPVAKQIRLSSGYGCMGPDPVHPCNGPVGRALRLLLQNLGGAVPASGTMVIFGGCRHTNIIFAEDEDGSPWEPLSVELGFPEGSNVVTVYLPNGIANMQGIVSTTLGGLGQNAALMAGPTRDRQYKDPEGIPGIVLYSSGFAQDIASGLGYSKLDTKTHLWEKSRTPWELIEIASGAKGVLAALESLDEAPWLVEGQSWPITKDPKNIQLVVAGGDQGGHSYWIQDPSPGPDSAEIKLPAKEKWDALLAQAEEDLGPIAE